MSSVTFCLIFEIGYLREPRAHQVRLACLASNPPRIPVCLLPGQPPRAGVIGACQHTQLDMGTGDPNSCPSVCAASTLSPGSERSVWFCLFCFVLRLWLPCVEGEKYQINGRVGVPR